MIFRQPGAPSDLSFSAIEDAIGNSASGNAANLVLVAGETNAYTAGRIKERCSNISVVLVPDEMLSTPYAWCLSFGPECAVWDSGP